MFRKIARVFSAIFAFFQTPPRSQVAALCWRENGAGVEFLLVTTRKSKRWTPPKGWPMNGKSLAGAAVQEAWEEAGVVGDIGDQPVGAYTYEKFTRRDSAAQPVRVSVFAMKVRELADEYREAGQRKRKWMEPEEASAKVREADLAQLIRDFQPKP